MKKNIFVFTLVSIFSVACGNHDLMNQNSKDKNYSVPSSKTSTGSSNPHAEININVTAVSSDVLPSNVLAIDLGTDIADCSNNTEAYSSDLNSDD